MSSKLQLISEFIILTILSFICSTQGYKVNITKFGNCDDVSDVKVKITSVQYDYNDDGLCDTIHGQYNVYSVDTRKYELWMQIFQCPTTTLGQCNDNVQKYVEPLHCDRLHEGDSGPWYMVSKAMQGSRCGERMGEFQLQSAQLLPKYLTNYFIADPNLPRLRLQMLFHKIDDSGTNKDARACVNIEFNLIF